MAGAFFFSFSFPHTFPFRAPSEPRRSEDGRGTTNHRTWANDEVAVER